MSDPDVAIISPYPSLERSHHAGTSGVASYAANLARALRDSGARVHVVSPGTEGPRRVDSDGESITVERGFPTGAKGLRQAIRAVSRSGAAVAHLQFELFLYGGPTALLATLASVDQLRRNGTPTVTTMHQTVDPATVDRSYTRLHRVPVPAPIARLGIQALQRELCRRSDATVVHEEPFRHVLGAADVIPHGIERPGGIARQEARDRLDIGRDRFVALCFGFVAPYKGLETALEAGRIVGPPWQVVVAGGEHPRLAASGDDYEADLRCRYGSSARFTGWVPGEDVVAWFCAADVALFPYPEPFSSSGALALALACGTPALVSTRLGRCIGAPSEMLASTSDEIAARLHRLRSEPGALDELGRWTTALADGRGWSDVAGRHLAVYDRVAA